MSGCHKGQKRKRPKSYYIKCSKQNAKRARYNHLEVGMKGFLITCGSKEDIGVHESLNILNEYADRMYGAQSLPGDDTTDGAASAKTSQDDSKEDVSEEEEDIETALQKEVTALKDNKPQSKRFQRVNCPAKNCIFIKSNMEADPLELTLTILRDIAETKVSKSRYAQRIIPVQATCKVFYDDILKCIGSLVESYFRCPFGTKRTYSVMFKCRNNYSISREKMQAEIGNLLRDMNPLNECVYRNPDRIILVEICNKVCCIAMVYEFFELRKFNLIEIATGKVEKPDPNQSKPGSLMTVSDDAKDDENSLSLDSPVSNENKTRNIEDTIKTEALADCNKAESQSNNDNGETNQPDLQAEHSAENKSDNIHKENNPTEKASKTNPAENNSAEIKLDNPPAKSMSENDLTENNIVDNEGKC